MRALSWGLRLLVLLLLPYVAGCCCSCSGTGNLPALFRSQGGRTAPTEQAPGPPDGSDPDLAQGWNNAQQALTNLKVGTVQTATLSKDGTRWYISGTVRKDKDGAVVPFDVQFEVIRADNTQIWNVQAVKVEEAVIFP